MSGPPAIKIVEEGKFISYIYMQSKEIKDQCIERDNRFILREVKKKAFLVPMEWKLGSTPSILIINDTGVIIWEILKKKRRINDICELVSKKYSISLNIAKKDVISFLEELKNVGALKNYKRSKLSPPEQNKDLLSQDDFIYQLIKSEFKEHRLPISITLELTNRCNLNCIHCYIKNRNNHCRVQELNLNEINNILEKISDAGCFQVVLTGGEPLTHRYLKDVILALEKHGIFYSLYSNGTLFDEALVEYLEKHPPLVIEVSIYGITEMVYESITRKKGSYSKFRRSLNLLIEKKFDLRLKTIVMKNNFNELRLIKDFCKDQGIEFRYDSLITPAINGSLYPTKVRLHPKKVVDIERKDKDIYNEYMNLSDEDKDKIKYYNCGAGKYEANIDFQGRLSLCGTDRVPFYDLLEGNFKEGWDFLDKLREIEYPINSKCISCEKKRFCKICPGWLKIEKQPINGKVDYLCAVAEERHKIFKEGR